jgi:hypothetical protein
MAPSADELKHTERSRRRLAAMPAEESRDVAWWLREEIAPELSNERQRELAEQSALRFEHRATERAAD